MTPDDEPRTDPNEAAPEPAAEETGKPAPRLPLTPARFLYGILRLFQILWISAVMPLAIYHIRTSGVPLTGFDAGVFYFAGCLWALMIVGIDQIAYPARLAEALLSTGITVLATIFSFFASGRDLLFSAYTIFMASLVTQTGLFMFVAVWMPLKMRSEIKTPKDFGFFLFITACYLAFFIFTAVYTVKFMGPFLKFLTGLPTTLLKAALAGSLAIQAAGWARQFLGASILAKPSAEKQEREALFQEWIVPFCIGMLLSVLVSLFMFMK